MTPPPPTPSGPGEVVFLNHLGRCRRASALAALLAALWGLVSCASPNLPWAAKLDNPVIFVPGIPGTVLESSSDGEVLWGKLDFGPQAKKEQGSRLALDFQPEGPLDGNGKIVPVKVMDRVDVKVLGLPTHWYLYAPLLRRMADMEPAPERGKYFHCFAYDWRLDCAENARRLHRFMESTAAQLERDFPERFGKGKEEVRFDIVVHSTGALLTRYALCYGDVPLETALQRRGESWRSADRCRKFIQVNPANGGTLRSFERLMRGYTYGPMLPQWNSAVLGTLPSLYQLMPAEQGAVEVSAEQGATTVSLMDVHVWQQQEWGLFAPETKADLTWIAPDMPKEKRDAMIMQHVAACLHRASDFRAAMNGTSRVPSEVEFDLMIGTSRQTPSRARFDRKSRTLKSIQREPGDSVVTLSSALAMPGLAPTSSKSGSSSPQWHSIYYGHRDHITGIVSYDWTRRISRLLTSHGPGGIRSEPVRPRTFFDRSLP